MTTPCPCCGHTLQILVTVQEAPNPPMVRTPARCTRCGTYFQEQGIVVGRCPCGGELETLHGKATPPAKAA
jgi:hypothetical protein